MRICVVLAAKRSERVTPAASRWCRNTFDAADSSTRLESIGSDEQGT
jgi:hypothetical protein